MDDLFNATRSKKEVKTRQMRVGEDVEIEDYIYLDQVFQGRRGPKAIKKMVMPEANGIIAIQVDVIGSIGSIDLNLYNKLGCAVKGLPLGKFKLVVKNYLLENCFYNMEEYMHAPPCMVAKT